MSVPLPGLGKPAQRPQWGQCQAVVGPGERPSLCLGGDGKSIQSTVLLKALQGSLVPLEDSPHSPMCIPSLVSDPGQPTCSFLTCSGPCLAPPRLPFLIPQCGALALLVLQSGSCGLLCFSFHKVVAP